jgi:predicted DNA-binding protein
MKTISLKLPDVLLMRLESESKQRRITKSQLVRESLEQAFNNASGRPPSCFDLARDLAGSVKAPPKDIATNPKYLDGFGR